MKICWFLFACGVCTYNGVVTEATPKWHINSLSKFTTTLFEYINEWSLYDVSSFILCLVTDSLWLASWEQWDTSWIAWNLFVMVTQILLRRTIDLFCSVNFKLVSDLVVLWIQFQNLDHGIAGSIFRYITSVHKTWKEEVSTEILL